MRQTVLIIGFNRPNLLENCIKSVLAADDNELFEKVLVLQKGDLRAEKIADDYREILDVCVFVDGSNFSTIENISRNRYLGYQIGFDFLQSDLVVALEEDVEISFDALTFSLLIHKKFESVKQYRGINFGSSIPREKEEPDTYSLIRFGIMGPASAIPKQTWKKFDFEKLMKKKNEDWDGAMEPYIKTGFMVTPNLSRYIDLGTHGVHARAGVNESYFKGLEESFVGSHRIEYETYKLKNTQQKWRRDAILWKRHQDLSFQIRKMILSRKNGLMLVKTYTKLLRSIDRNKSSC